MTKLAERGENLGAATSKLLRLLGAHGGAALERAVQRVLERDVPHHHAVQQLLEQERRRAGKRPRVPVGLPADPRVRDLHVRSHPLASYDELTEADSAASDEEGTDGRS